MVDLSIQKQIVEITKKSFKFNFCPECGNEINSEYCKKYGDPIDGLLGICNICNKRWHVMIDNPQDFIIIEKNNEEEIKT